MLATMTTKGQITIPKSVRDRLELRAGDKVEFLVDASGRVELVPLTSSLADLKGMVPKPKRAVSLGSMKKAIQRRGSKAKR